MIKRVFANHSSFKSVEFSKGFNVVMADRTKDSTKTDSRNGLGKSTLIEIIHFCLGSSSSRNKGLIIENLAGWVFSLEIEVGKQDIIISRSVDHPNVITVNGDVSKWPIIPKSLNGDNIYRLNDWNLILGYILFCLPVSYEEKIKYTPSFRSLISFFIRKGKDAFSTPFEHYRKQLEWDRQVNNAFLLGLAWENAGEFQLLKDRKKGIENFKKAAEAGVIKGFIGSRGDLEAQEIRLSLKSRQEEEALKSFKVHPEYKRIQEEANQLTSEIHEAVNDNLMTARLVELYENGLKEESPPEGSSIERVYKEAGVVFPDILLRRFDEVQKFHNSIIENRRVFLESEVERLKRECDARENYIKDKSEARASKMKVLQTHGALEEYIHLQERYVSTLNDLKSISSMIDNLKSFETGLSDIKIETEVLQKKTRRDYDERRTIRERAISLFNDYSQRLYSAPGKLLIDVGPSGFNFDVEIERSGSTGIDNMKVFCYDLMLARLWAGKSPSPGLLIHDSTIFDGVDERQRASALETAEHESSQHNFQYICTLNSDNVPWNEFSGKFNLRNFVKLTLTDVSENGCLLGIKF